MLSMIKVLQCPAVGLRLGDVVYSVGLQVRLILAIDC